METSQKTSSPCPPPPCPPPMNTRYNISIKVVYIVLITFVIGVGLLCVGALTSERESTGRKASSEILSTWGDEALITGPLFVNSVDSMEFAPQKSLKITAQVNAEKLHRGIYDTQVYNAKVTMSGKIAKALIDGPSKRNVLRIDLPVSQITHYDPLEIGGREYGWKQGPDYVYAIIDTDGLPEEAEYTLSFDVRGSSKFGIRYPAVKSDVVISGTGEGVSFGWTPNSRIIDGDKFEARWIEKSGSVDGLRYEANGIDINGAQVDFTTGVDLYQKVKRTIKYGIILIILTFSGIFVLEVTNRRKLPVYVYFLVGIALVLFYVLLLSFSEIIGFGPAYLVAALMTVGLISCYLARQQGQIKSGILTAAVLSLIYALIYIIFCADQYALLLGSLLMFVTLVAVMFATLTTRSKT